MRAQLTRCKNFFHSFNNGLLTVGLMRVTVTGRLKKLQEEVEELVDAHEYGDSFEVRDAVGDIMVVLIGYCLQTGLDIVHCLDGAYNEIKDRTGKVNKNGVFVKDE